METDRFQKLVNDFIACLLESDVYLSPWRRLTRLTFSYMSWQLVFYFLEIIATDRTWIISDHMDSSPVVERQIIKFLNGNLYKSYELWS